LQSRIRFLRDCDQGIHGQHEHQNRQTKSPHAASQNHDDLNLNRGRYRSISKAKRFALLGSTQSRVILRERQSTSSDLPNAAPAHEKMNLVTRAMKPLFAALIATIFIFATHPAHAAGSKADEEAGAILFHDKGCAYCHGAGGVGGKKAPALTTIRTDKAWPPAKITTQILNGGQKMPPFGDSLTDAQIAQLVAYLRAKIRPVPPPAPAAPAPPPQ
jgi:mono/diheme cytochrome c family protein